MNISRKGLFYFFLLIYLVSCPLLILHTFGYLDQLPSSSLYIETNPPGATVFLANSRYAEKTPVVLENLLPGRYYIKLILNGHLPAHYRVFVRPNTDVALEHIVLMTEDITVKKLNSGSFEGLTDISSDEHFLLSYGQDVEDYNFYDIEQNRLLTFTSGNILPWGTDILDINTVDKSSDLIIKANALGEIKYVYFKPLADSLVSKDITGLFVDQPEHIEWDPNYPAEVFTFQNNYVNRLDLAAGKVYQRYFEDCIGYAVYNGSVFIVKDILSLRRYDYEKNRVDMLINDPVLGERLFANGSYFKIRPLFTNMILLLGNRGDLSLNKAPHKFVEEGVKGFKFDRGLKRLLFWQSDRIGILDLGMRDSSFATIPKVIWIFQGAGDIEQAYWANGGSHILFKDQDRIFLFELKIRNTSRLQPLQSILKVKEGSSVHYSDQRGTLYYLGPDSGRLLSARIIPEVN